MPLHKVIKNFCAMQGNEKESYFTKMAIYAKWAWRDLYVNTIFDYRTVIMNVCPPDFTIRIPDDCERVFNVSIIDKHNRKHPLSLNTNINTAKLLCPTVKCSCQCGGQDTLCSVIDTLTTTTQTVMIEGSPYTWTTWMNYDRDGSIQQVDQIPALDTLTNTVVYTKYYKTICNVEVTDKGCIKPTDSNKELLRNFLGGDLFGDIQRSVTHQIIPASYNDYGYWNWDAACGDIIHIFGHPDWRHNHPQYDNEFKYYESSIHQVMLTYQTNGQTPDTEILVPEYGVEALNMGIIHRQKVYGMRVSSAEKEQALQDYRREKSAVYRYLNSLRIDDIRKLQAVPIVW